VRVTGLSHVGLSTPDFERALTFYTQALGFAEIVRFSWDAGNPAADAGLGLADTAADIAVLTAGNTYLEVLHFRSPLPVRLDEPPTLFREGITHIALETPDVEAVRRLILQAGGSEVERGDATATSRLVRDPDGNLIELRTTASVPVGGYTALTVETPGGATPVEGLAPRPTPRRDHVLGIHHAGVCTLDLEATSAFYQQAGLTVIADGRWDLGDTASQDASRMVAGQGRAQLMTFGNAYLELLQYDDVDVSPRPQTARIIEYGFNHLCVDVDDIGRLHEHLSGQGMTSHAPWVAMPGGHAAMGYALDVQGTPIELLEHRTQASTMWPGHLNITPSP
jgi:catechol 2,3-dioxygenase-like lactoylglutathione lyase family enzyme